MAEPVNNRVAGKPRVVITEDEPHLRKLFQVMMGALNTEVVALASNGYEAVDYYRKARPHLMLMDINLPGKTGDEALEDIMAEFPHAFIIMLTSVSDLETVKKCLDLGASNYILKDTPISEMKEIIKSTWKTRLNKMRKRRQTSLQQPNTRPPVPQIDARRPVPASPAKGTPMPARPGPRQRSAAPAGARPSVTTKPAPPRPPTARPGQPAAPGGPRPAPGQPPKPGNVTRGKTPPGQPPRPAGAAPGARPPARTPGPAGAQRPPHPPAGTPGPPVKRPAGTVNPAPRNSAPGRKPIPPQQGAPGQKPPTKKPSGE